MNAKSKELLVFLQGNPLGILSEDTQGRHVFTYLPESDVSLNLSIALPHRTSPWTGAAVEAYIDGILPDDPMSDNASAVNTESTQEILLLFFQS